MNKIKTIKKGKYTLKHEWYLDDMGVKRTCIELFDEEKRVHIPFMEPLRVLNLTRSTPIFGEDTSAYSDEEYEEMMNEEIAKYEKD